MGLDGSVTKSVSPKVLHFIVVTLSFRGLDINLANRIGIAFLNCIINISALRPKASICSGVKSSPSSISSSSSGIYSSSMANNLRKFSGRNVAGNSPIAILVLASNCNTELSPSIFLEINYLMLQIPLSPVDFFHPVSHQREKYL